MERNPDAAATGTPPSWLGDSITRAAPSAREFNQAAFLHQPGKVASGGGLTHPRHLLLLGGADPLLEALLPTIEQAVEPNRQRFWLIQ